MPYYTFKNTDTQEEFVLSMKMDEKEPYLEANPHIHYVPGAPALHSGQGLGVRKVDDGFKDLLGNVKRNNPGNTINT